MKGYKYKGVEYPFQIDVLAWEEFEGITGQPFHKLQEARIGLIMAALYCGLKRGSQLNGKTFDVQYEDFREELAKQKVKPLDLTVEVLNLAELNDDSEEAEEEPSEEK